jgi:four helix bundle protein
MEENVKYYFDHEKLNVYKRSIDFIKWTNKLIRKINSKNSTIDQLERASDSIVLNISEGNGKYTPRDKCRYFDISRGSAMESAACLDVLLAKNLISIEENDEGKKFLVEIVKMLMGLIKSTSGRSYEELENYDIQ